MKKFFLTFYLSSTILLSGCSSTFAYNNIDWLVYWYLDDYLELEAAQKQLLDVQIEQWHHWHRSKELPKYKTQLEELREQIKQGPLTQQQWLNEFAKGRQHWERFRDEISPQLSKLALSLDDKQIEQLFAELEKENLEEQQEIEELSKDERLEDRIERLQERVKDNIGRLSSQQKQIVSDYAPLFVSTAGQWVEYRRAIQAKAKALLLARHHQSDFATQLNSLITHPEQFRSEAYLQASEQNRQLYAQMVAQLNTTLSDKQKRKLDSKLEDLIESIDDLIDD